jgi:PHD/YefM family antitoxin component YafN of YafNO toxin-antitoxin module
MLSRSTWKDLKMSDDLSLGRLLGRREAFNLIAARCSAADAVLLRKIRDEKLYVDHAKDWEEFCREHLHTSKPNANRLIHILEEFGPQYFEVAQLTRISPKTYRAIAPSIRDQSLHHNGEAIALIPENAEKVAAAVAELRRKEVEPAPPADPIPTVEKSCGELVRRLEELIATRQHKQRLKAVLCSMQSKLHYLELTL